MISTFLTSDTPVLVRHYNGGHGIWFSAGRVFVAGVNWEAMVHWLPKDVVPVSLKIPDELWARYVAWRLSQ